jgi:small subunit ribosomal protein S17
MAEERRDSGVKARRARTGTVASVGGDKTIRVIVNNLVKHPMYGKYVRRRTKLAVHDPQNAAQLDDVVEIIPCRRMSKTKSWRLVRIVRRGDALPPAVEQEV